MTLFSQGPDSLRTKSGETITGELESMNQAVLIFETSYSDSDFRIDWEEVESIITAKNFKVFDTDGNQYRGLLRPVADSSGYLKIETAEDTFVMKLTDIAIIEKAYDSFMDRITLGIHLGYHYTKANRSQQFTTRSNVGYIGRK